MIGAGRQAASAIRPRPAWLLAPVLAAVAVAIGGLLGGVLPIPEVAVGESLDPAQTLAARASVEAVGKTIETTRGDVDRVLRAADVQQIIGPATVCETVVTAECGAQLRAVQSGLAGWADLLARQPDYERALSAYDQALMAQTRALGGAGEPLREATWPVVGAANQLTLIRTKYAAFYDQPTIEATRAGLASCADLGAGAPFPPQCAVAVAAALKIGQSIEARATVDDDYRRALDRYQRALDERVAIVSDAPRPGVLARLANGATVLLIALGGGLLAWRGAPRRREAVRA